ncbi:MAG: hypothetical protein ACJ77E_07685 [Gaiellaceae bacterium]
MSDTLSRPRACPSLGAGVGRRRRAPCRGGNPKHKNPEQKTAAYVSLTDFVGWLPMPDGGEHEAMLTADYNAEMIEHVARYPRVRDRAIFVGEADDVVPDAFGPGLPRIRDWTKQHYEFAGYVTGFDPAALADRDRLRAELGFGFDERVCVVAVGGSGVGGHLPRRVVDALRRHLPPGRRRRRCARRRVDRRVALENRRARATAPGR